MPATGACAHSPQPGHRSLRFKRRSAGDVNPRFERRSPQLLHYSGDGSRRLGCRSSQPEHGILHFKRRSAGDVNPRFERRSPQLLHYSGDGSRRLGRRSSHPRHGGPRTKRRSPQPRAAQESDCCACTSLLSARVSYSSTSQACGGGRFDVREGRHRIPDISGEARLGVSS